MRNGLPYIRRNGTVGPGEKAVFVHFSGMSLLEEYDMNTISRYQTRFTLDDFPEMEGVLGRYVQLLESKGAMEYRKIPYGFGEYSDGTVITKSMRRMYAAASFPIFGSSLTIRSENPLDINFSPLVRAAFQNQVISNPFCASDDCYKGKSKTTFIDWCFQSNEFSVDLDGAFFFSALERSLWDRRPDLQKAFPDPHGADYENFKTWFQHDGKADNDVSKVFHRWKRIYSFHRDNPLKFHKQIGNDNFTDVGVNIFGWHSGLFSIGLVALKYVMAANAVNMNVNAVHAKYIITKEFASPLDLGISVTRSCSEAVNLVVMNAPETVQYENEIPERMRKDKYQIGYWVSFVALF